MLYLVISMIIAMFIWWVCRYRDNNLKSHIHNFGNFLECFFMGLFIGVMALWFFGNFVGSFIPYELKLTNTYQIILSDSQHNKYVIKDKDGLNIYDTKTLNANINFTDSKPYIEEYSHIYNDKWKYIFGNPSGFKSGSCYYEFYLSKTGDNS